LPQHGTQQAGADFLAAILQSSTSRAVVKGGMATLALQFIEPQLDPTVPTEPPQPADEFVAGHRGKRAAFHSQQAVRKLLTSFLVRIEMIHCGFVLLVFP
jgi:hypothetical protein